ncbi:Uu.00g025990.m01.CDS01 [Anthostomella pinea]|uniref:Uu.00g025990.m01.CDS01 n=1 Tax=Anthostomella pinea TaxID=933095 RepID=A0AAI8V7F6_9PEZI|nr:Uu.00g025990.m01.CDS01 [Anthostomella pinea]
MAGATPPQCRWFVRRYPARGRSILQARPQQPDGSNEASKSSNANETLGYLAYPIEIQRMIAGHNVLSARDRKNLVRTCRTAYDNLLHVIYEKDRDEGGFKALEHGVKTADVALLERTVEFQGRDILAHEFDCEYWPDGHGYARPTALALAVRSLRVDVVRFLLSKGADANHSFDIYLVPSYSRLNQVWPTGISISQSEAASCFPIHLALSAQTNRPASARLEVVKSLLEHGAEPNRKSTLLSSGCIHEGVTPLSLSLETGISAEVLRLLLDRGANQTEVDLPLTYFKQLVGEASPFCFPKPVYLCSPSPSLMHTYGLRASDMDAEPRDPLRNRTEPREKKLAKLGVLLQNHPDAGGLTVQMYVTILEEAIKPNTRDLCKVLSELGQKPDFALVEIQVGCAGNILNRIFRSLMLELPWARKNGNFDNCQARADVLIMLVEAGRNPRVKGPTGEMSFDWVLRHRKKCHNLTLKTILGELVRQLHKHGAAEPGAAEHGPTKHGADELMNVDERLCRYRERQRTSLKPSRMLDDALLTAMMDTDPTSSINAGWMT